jgi:outer membrane immunogenic protein
MHRSRWGRAVLDFIKVLFVVLVSAICLPALAEDIGLKAPGDKSQPVVWNGAYVGLHVGGQHVDSQSSSSATGLSGSSSANNFLGGALAGYNWQTGAWVVGIEGDWSLINNSALHPNLFTLRGRAGWAHEDVLLYVTAGAGTKNDRLSRGVLSGGVVQIFQSSEQQSFGPVAGGGVELRLPHNFSARTEGLYYFENPKYDLAATTFNNLQFPATTFDQKQHHFIYRASVIYNFDGPR